MGTIAASVVIAQASRILSDAGNSRWTQTELLGWISAGQREVVMYKPEANAVTSVLALTVGKTNQDLPASAALLLDITRNMGVDLATPGRAVRSIRREMMDLQRPGWHSDAAQPEIKHFMYDPRNPRKFFVWPKPSLAIGVEAVLSQVPTDITVPTSAIAVDDIYLNALVDYTLFRSFSKDAAIAGSAQRAVAHYQAFANAMGIKSGTDLTRTPA